MELRKYVIVSAIIISFTLFFAGWYSGLSARNAIKNETTSTLEIAKQQLKENMRAVESNLDSAQLESLFVKTLDDDEACEYFGIITKDLMDELQSFWSILPPRLEALTKEESAAFNPVKEDYNRLSVRGWVFFRDVYKRCKTTPFPILYLYEPGCDECVKQGLEIDKVKQKLGGDSIIVFTVDTSANYTVLSHLKQYYGFKSVPALITEKVLQERVFSADEIADAVEK